MKLFRIWCEECQNEYEITPIHESSTDDDITPKVCPMCASKIDELLYDDEDEDLL